MSPLRFLRKLPRRVTSRPEIEISDKRSAFSSQTPSIEPSYKTGPKQVKIKISRKVQGFLKKFRVQHVALTVRRPKHPCLVWCTPIFLCENFSRLVPRDPMWGDHSKYSRDKSWDRSPDSVTNYAPVYYSNSYFLISKLKMSLFDHMAMDLAKISCLTIMLWFSISHCITY